MLTVTAKLLVLVGCVLATALMFMLGPVILKPDDPTYFNRPSDRK